MDFREKSEHYFKIAFAMKEAGKSEEAIESYLQKEDLDANEVFLILERLDDEKEAPIPVAAPKATESGGGGGRKVLGVPLKIIGIVFGVLGIGLAVMKLVSGDHSIRGYVVAGAALLVGVVFFVQGKG